MDSIQKLTELFKQFPGIGPRQAKRFVYFLLGANSSYRNELIDLIETLKNNIKICTSCYRFFNQEQPSSLCNICNKKTRDRSTLLIVSRDVDLESIEKSGAYNGLYFVLGGTIPILDKEPEKKVRLNELVRDVSDRIESGGLKEIILGLSANPEGEHTGEAISTRLRDVINKHNIRISLLGRGLSTGSEIEYSDGDTIEQALKNRKN